MTFSKLRAQKLRTEQSTLKPFSKAPFSSLKRLAIQQKTNRIYWTTGCIWAFLNKTRTFYYNTRDKLKSHIRSTCTQNIQCCGTPWAAREGIIPPHAWHCKCTVFWLQRKLPNWVPDKTSTLEFVYFFLQKESIHIPMDI